MKNAITAAVITYNTAIGNAEFAASGLGHAWQSFIQPLAPHWMLKDGVTCQAGGARRPCTCDDCQDWARFNPKAAKKIGFKLAKAPK